MEINRINLEWILITETILNLRREAAVDIDLHMITYDYIWLHMITYYILINTYYKPYLMIIFIKSDNNHGGYYLKLG